MAGSLFALPILPTAVVGSHPQPDWLIDRAQLSGHVPRVRFGDLWRVPPELRQQAQRDAATLAIAEIEAAGVDIVTDGEVDRESYSNHLLTGLDGIDVDNPGTIVSRAGHKTSVPRIVGPVRLARDTGTEALRHLVATTSRVPKVTLPGPFTVAQQCQDEFYGDREALATDLAVAINQQALALEAAGAQVIQFDEPWYRNDPASAERFAVRVLDRALEGLTCRTVVHLCFGYAAVTPSEKPTAYAFLAPLGDSTVDEISIEAAQPRLDLGVLAELSNKRIMLGVLDLDDLSRNSPDAVVERARHGLAHVDAERLTLAPDCGMKYLSRADACRCLGSLVAAARTLRAEH